MGDTLSRAGKHLAAIRLIDGAGNRHAALRAFIDEYGPIADLVGAARQLDYVAQVDLGLMAPVPSIPADVEF